jgi:hypothetical protein
VIDVFTDDLDISGLGFKAGPNVAGRPGYHPKTMLKLPSSAAKGSWRGFCECKRHDSLPLSACSAVLGSLNHRCVGVFR